MKLQELKSLIASGEDSQRQFKINSHHADSLASEMAAFANSEGGNQTNGASIPRKSSGDFFNSALNSMHTNCPPAPIGSPKGSPKSSPKSKHKIVQLIEKNASISTEQMAEVMGVSKRTVLNQISKLKALGQLQRMGPASGGYWEVL